MSVSAKELVSAISRLEGKLHNGGRYAGGGSQSIFGGATIPATQILAKPDSLYAGRQAASQKMSGDDSWKLPLLLNANLRERTRHVIYLGGVPESIDVAENTELHRIGYALAIGEPPLDASCCILDLRGHDKNPWSDVVDATRTTDFLILDEFLRKCKDIHIPVVLIPAQVPSHFSSQLSSLADVIVSEESTTLESDEMLKTFGIRAIESGGES